MKIALVVGHTSKAQGAVIVNSRITEYLYNRDIAFACKALQYTNPCTVEVFFRDVVGLEGCYKKVSEWKPDCVIELHFNAFNEKSKGSVVIFNDDNDKIKGSELDLAKRLQKMMNNVFGYEDRPFLTEREIGKADRGYSNVTQLNGVPVVLLEPAFGSNPFEAALLLTKKADYAKGIIRSCLDWGAQWVLQP